MAAAATATTATSADAYGAAYADLAAPLTAPFAADVLHAVAGVLERPTTRRVLDIGCGAGAFALAHLARYPRGIPGQTVCSADASPAMVAAARRAVAAARANLADCATAFEFVVADAETLPGFADASVQVVVSAFALNNLARQDRAFAQVRRVLAADGAPVVVAAAAWNQLPAGMTGYGIELEKAGGKASIAMTVDSEDGPDGDANGGDGECGGCGDEEDGPWTQWGDPSSLKRLMTGYGLSDVRVARCVHSLCTGDKHALWDTLVKACLMTDMSAFSQERVAEMKERFFDSIGEKDNDGAVFIVAGANIMTATVKL